MLILGMAIWVFFALVVVCGAIIYAVEKEYSFGAFVGLLISGVLLHFTGTVNMLEVMNHWQQLLGFVLAYLVSGALWAMLKWRFYVSAWAQVQIDNLDRCRRQFFSEINSITNEGLDSDTVPSKYAELFEVWSLGENCYTLTNQLLGTRAGIQSPAVRVAKSDELGILRNLPRIMTWCLYWPFSMIWTLIDDPFKKAVRFLIVNVLGGIFSAISKHGVNAVDRKRQSMIEKS